MGQTAVEGRTYYINTNSGAFSWERPKDALKLFRDSNDGAQKGKSKLSIMQALGRMDSRQDPSVWAKIDASKEFETREYRMADRTPGAAEITLAYQSDAGRLDRLVKIVDQWKGPVSASILLQENEIKHVDEIIEKNNLIRKHVDLYLCVAPRKWTYYPINTLRNHANSNVRTNYLFI